MPELDQLPEYVHKIYENESYVVYEFTDLPKAPRIPLFIDTDWSSFIKLLSTNLNLTRYYDLRHPVSRTISGLSLAMALGHRRPACGGARPVYQGDTRISSLRPASNIFAFSPDTIPSSYYLSPMFRLFQFFSDSKWNRLNMITPGLFGTIKGSFIGVPVATRFRIDANVPAPGKYHVLLRGAATVNEI